MSFFFACGQNQNSIVEKIAQTDQLFKKWNTEQSPGLTIGIIKNGHIIYTNGYGMANLEHNISNTPNTAFNIASNSK